jgi:hypothetical protein
VQKKYIVRSTTEERTDLEAMVKKDKAAACNVEHGNILLAAGVDGAACEFLFAGSPARLTIVLLEEIQCQYRQHGAGLLISRYSRTEFYSMSPTHLLNGPMRFRLYNPMADFKQHYGEKLYWEKEHGHFTPLGCKVVGEGLARTVLDSGLLEGDDREQRDH